MEFLIDISERGVTMFRKNGEFHLFLTTLVTFPLTHFLPLLFQCFSDDPLSASTLYSLLSADCSCLI